MGSCLFGRSDVGYGQVPVGDQYLEAELLFALVCGLVWIKLLDECFLIGIGGGGCGGVGVFDDDAIIPAAVFGGVIGGGFDFDAGHAAGLDDFLEQRVVVLEEEVQELLLMAHWSL